MKNEWNFKKYNTSLKCPQTEDRGQINIDNKILVNVMTYFRELPKCIIRFGRTDIIENGDKKLVKMIMTCGYREVYPEDCIVCGGFQNVKFEFRVDTFIRVVKSGKEW